MSNGVRLLDDKKLKILKQKHTKKPVTHEISPRGEICLGG